MTIPQPALPATWRWQPLDSLSRVKVSTVDKKSYPDEVPVRLCNYTDVYYQDVITSDLAFMEATASAEQISRFSVQAGDVPITKDSETSDDIGRPSYVPEDLPGVVYGYHLAIYQPFDPNYSKFIRYLFDSSYIRAELQTRTPGVTRVGLSQDTLRNLRVPTPPPYIAAGIADYLDHETAEIDAFVEDQHKILHLVSERRWSAIDRAIEQGTERVPLRRLAKYLTSGSRNWSSLLSESGDPFVRITNISRNHVRILSEDMEFVAGVEDAEGARAKIQMGDILMSITADLGSVALADESIEGGYTSQHVCLIRPNNQLADPKYVAYALLSSKVKAQIAEKSYGGTKIQLSLEDVRELEIPLPPLQEQRGVAQQCEDYVTTTEGLSSELQRIIALSRERRAALITAAVTGQIDVTAKNKPAAEQIEDDVAQGLHREYA